MIKVDAKKSLNREIFFRINTYIFWLPLEPTYFSLLNILLHLHLTPEIFHTYMIGASSNQNRVECKCKDALFMSIFSNKS